MVLQCFTLKGACPAARDHIVTGQGKFELKMIEKRQTAQELAT